MRVQKIMKKLVACVLTVVLLISFGPASYDVYAMTLAGNTRGEKVYNYFVEKGYSPYAAAAIVGNIMMEAGGGGILDFPLHTVETGSGSGIGMCQWTGSRREDFEEFCLKNGVSWTESSLELQLEFLTKELNSPGYWIFSSKYSSALDKYNISFNDFKNSTDLELATGAFCFCFERPSETYAHMENRVAYAATVLAVVQGSTEVEIWGNNLPERIMVGSSFSIKGVVSSGAKLTNVTVGVYDEEGNAMTAQGTTPKGCNYDIKYLDDYITFGILKPGVYYYRVLATNSSGTKIVVNHAFRVLDEKDATIVFDDIYDSDWFADSVRYVYDNRIMSGNAGSFNPNGNMSRAMMMTTLYRLSGSPQVNNYDATTSFGDILSGSWYEDAVNWAYEKGVTTGYPEIKQFGVDDNLTREQLAVFLYRYADNLGLDVSAEADITGYVGYDEISDYAKHAMKWAIATGFIRGIEFVENGVTIYNLAPHESATRAQTATILMRFCTYYNM